MGDKQIKSDYFCWSTRGNFSEPDGQQRRVHPVCLFREKRGRGRATDDGVLVRGFVGLFGAEGERRS